MDDDDAPPPLSSLTEQVAALQLQAQGSSVASTSASDAQLRVASTVVVTPKQAGTGAAKSAAPALKKGFFDAKPAKPTPKPKAKDDEVEEIPMLKARKGAPSGPQIPDFMRVQPDDQKQKYDAFKQKMVETLKPTPDTVMEIAKNPELLQAFDDPEVMAAVSDIAKNPQNFVKYRSNAKVMQFYATMGQFMGDKLEKMGAAQQQQQQQPQR